MMNQSQISLQTDTTQEVCCSLTLSQQQHPICNPPFPREPYRDTVPDIQFMFVSFESILKQVQVRRKRTIVR